MNAAITSKQANTTSYPMLMIHKDGDFIVLFSAPKIGTCVLNIDPHDVSKIGEVGTDYYMEDFNIFEESLTLSN